MVSLQRLRIISSRLGILYTVASLVLLSTFGSGQIPAGYYNPASGQSGEALQVALYNIIKGHTVVSYTPGVWDAIYSTDVKANGKVWDMYSDVPGGTPPYEFTLGSSQCGSGGGGVEGNCYSREHSFPKSWFNDLSPMYTDLFHIYPVDQYVNNRRNDNPYGTVASPTWTSLNGGKLGPCSTPGYSGTVFEPIDAYKGDFARTYFYMATRYENVISTWKNNNPNGAAVLDGSSYPAYQTWFLNLLIQWHDQDPVSAKEIARNDSVYKIQNNRNPYIDHPEYVAAVWTPGGSQPEPSNHVTNFSAAEGIPPYNSIQVTWVDATGPVLPNGYLIRGSSVSFAAIVTPVDGAPVTSSGLDKVVGTGVQSCTFTGLSSATTYYFKIFPYTNSGSAIDYNTTNPVPTASATTSSGISLLQAGDIAIIEYGSINPDKFSFVTFKQLNAGTEINFTDNSYSSATTVRTGEGFLYYVAPTIIPAGTVVSWYNGMTITGTGWSSNNPSNFAFNESGDQLFVYQGTWGTTQSLLCGLNAGNSGWITTGTALATTSYLPSVLTDQVNSMTMVEKCGNYNLIVSGTANVLGSLAENNSNWTKSSLTLPTPSWAFSIGNITTINLDATVLHLVIGNDEFVTVQPGIVLTVTGNATLE
jgi:endonuclease I